MTDKPTPTDAEILDAAEDFRSQYTHGGTTFDEFDEIGFARAVLAKWGGSEAQAAAPIKTLEEAIAHAEDKAKGNSACAMEHAKLAAWLTELQLLRAAQTAPVDTAVQQLTKASRNISTVLRVEGMDLEIGSRRLLREARDAIDAAIAAQQGGQ